MNEQQTATEPAARKRERSPSFPFIPLGKVVARVKTMDEHHKQFPASTDALAKTWKLTPKSSTFLQTVAAAKAFGLIDDNGTGQSRRLKVSDLARRVLHDTRPGVREAALKEAAVKPKLLRQFAKTWKNGRPSDDHCISELQLDHKFTKESASNFLKVFDDTFRFAGGGPSDSVVDSDNDADEAENPPEPPAATVKVGDYIQWESQGQLQFTSPRRVTKTDFDPDHGWYVWVEGYAGALPMSQARPAESTKTPTPPPAPELGAEHQAQIHIERATMPLPEGLVALEFPSSMSQATYEDFKAWVEVILKRAERSVKKS